MEVVVIVVFVFVLVGNAYKRITMASTFRGKDVADCHEQVHDFVGKMTKSGWELKSSSVKEVRRERT